MPKAKSYDRDELTALAMERFWANGFYATSIDDLVKATGVSRHGLYVEFRDKRGMFLASLEMYLGSFVQAAFGPVEARRSGVQQIRAYFEHLITLAEENGLPGPGCLMANTMVESAPHDAEFRGVVQRHLDRLQRGFGQAIRYAQQSGDVGAEIDAESFARFLTISAQGLWSASRLLEDADMLRAYVGDLLGPLDGGGS